MTFWEDICGDNVENSLCFEVCPPINALQQQNRNEREQETETERAKWLLIDSTEGKEVLCWKIKRRAVTIQERKQLVQEDKELELMVFYGGQQKRGKSDATGQVLSLTGNT